MTGWHGRDWTHPATRMRESVTCLRAILGGEASDYEGRYVRTKVIDRGPFANGAKWDLTQATARALEFEYTDHIRVAKLGT